MKRRLFLFCICIFIFLFSRSQDSCNLQISLLTCGPGEELYSTFGHTAIRVHELSSGNDYVFNYGTFEFGPDFYTKFMNGSLLYFLSVEDFNSFLQEYQMESRTVQEQILQMNCKEKIRLLNELKLNAQPQNRYYRYDFLYDNCTTRAKNMIIKNADTSVAFKNILPPAIPTFRQLIHLYLNAKKEYWSKLGIDILLGANIDKKVTNEQAMFLPDYLLNGFNQAKEGKHALVSKASTILAMPVVASTSPLFSPIVIFTIILFIIILLSGLRTQWTERILTIFDLIFFCLLGTAGILILLMWIGRVDTVCRNNFNILWALPTNFLIVFIAYKKSHWINLYFRIVFGISILLLITWFFLPQQMNNALLPVVMLTVLRSWKYSKSNQHGAQNHLVSK
ncbi:MAG: DUF4105 domain-containing protein [Flavisolibacter sp.]